MKIDRQPYRLKMIKKHYPKLGMLMIEDMIADADGIFDRIDDKIKELKDEKS